MFDLNLVAIVCVIFILAGFTKGVVGGGLPAISIGLLTTILSLQEAIALVVIPAFVANIWQACFGGHFKALIVRLWPYLISSMVAVALGTQILISMDPAILTLFLGLLIAIYSMLGVWGKEFSIAPSMEKISSPTFGFITGLIAGMTGILSYPGMFFLNGLGFTRNQLVQAMGISFSLMLLAIMISMQSNNLLPQQQFSLSIFAIMPTLAGMATGAMLRQRISEFLFKKLFYSSMLALGLYLVARSLFRISF